MELPRVERVDVHELIRRVAAAGGPRLRTVRPFSDGAHGAWVVARSDGTTSVLTWASPLVDGSGTTIDRTIELIDIARRAGVPAPRYQEVVALPEGDAVVLQERARGVPLTTAPTRRLVEALLDLAERRRGLLAGTRFAGQPSSLHLREDGPGYCLHTTLERHDDRSRRVLRAVERGGAAPGADVMVGDDLVHYDHHLANLLVDPDDPGRVTALVDWGGARSGDVALDLVILVLDLTLRAGGTDLADVVDRRL